MTLYSGRTCLFSALVLAVCIPACFGQDRWQMASPDSRTVLKVKLQTSEGRLTYEVTYDGRRAILPSPLGISRTDQAFIDGLRFVNVVPAKTIDESYTMVHGKRKLCRNYAKEMTLTFQNADGAKVDLILRAYDDGAAFCYRFPDKSEDTYTVTSEITGFKLPANGKMWAQPHDHVTQYAPAYEQYYANGAPVGTTSSHTEGWDFPLLFCDADQKIWGLVTEANMDGSYCGSHLQPEAHDGLYTLRFPEESEGNHTGSVQPSWTLPWTTPWRIIMVGDSPGAIIESTLVTNLSAPSVVEDTSWIKPGRASWSWLSDSDSPQDFNRLKPFIDLAAEMGWEYSLIDANWNIMKNGTIHELLAYAKDKGVGLTLWYNSGGPHNYVTEMPRGMMYFRNVRQYEMRRLANWGVKGIKVDFFQSDKQNIIQLYNYILQDAADHKIMLDFHGCTLPRGWSRTYPHMMTMEAVKGAEAYKFDRQFSERAPVHNTILPFTRNVVGPMDYTPILFDSSVFKRHTTNAHELALAVVFETGWVHPGDSVAGYRTLPKGPKQFLKDVPAAWDNTKYLSGLPGESITIARQKDKTWYIGSISGKDTAEQETLNLSFLPKGRYKATYIQDGQETGSFETQTKTVTNKDTLTLTRNPNGGYVVQLTPEP